MKIIPQDQFRKFKGRSLPYAQGMTKRELTKRVQTEKIRDAAGPSFGTTFKKKM